MPHHTPLVRPSPEQIAELPPYEALPLKQVHLVKTGAQLAFAERELRSAGHVGFDTESKPTFAAGVPQTGPHVVQFATLQHAFIFQTGLPEVPSFLAEAIESNELVKVGFGLESDRPQIQRGMGLTLGNSIDVSFMVRQLGFRQAVGVRTAVAVVLGQRMFKSKRVTTSNWASETLSAQQLQYAANDAHAALVVYMALRGQMTKGKVDRDAAPL